MCLLWSVSRVEDGFFGIPDLDMMGILENVVIMCVRRSASNVLNSASDSSNPVFGRVPRDKRP